MANAMRHHARRVNEDAPCTLTFARAPRERRVLVRKARVDAERIFDLRMNQLATLVEPSEFFAQPVHALFAAQCERGGPQAALTDAAERWQARKTAKMLVRDRAEYRAVFPEQLKPQRRSFDLQDCVACDEPPRPRRSRRCFAGCCPSPHNAVVGQCARSHPQSEHAFAEARHFEDIAGRRCERRAECRRVDALMRLDAKKRGRVEVHRLRRTAPLLNRAGGFGHSWYIDAHDEHAARLWQSPEL